MGSIMSIHSNIQKLIERFARTISKQTLGLVSYLPDEDGIPTKCFENVYSYVQKNGG